MRQDVAFLIDEQRQVLDQRRRRDDDAGGVLRGVPQQAFQLERVVEEIHYLPYDIVDIHLSPLAGIVAGEGGEPPDDLSGALRFFGHPLRLLRHRPGAGHLADGSRLGQRSRERTVELMGETAEEFPEGGHALAAEQGLALAPRLGPSPLERVHGNDGADDHGLPFAENAPAVRFDEHDAAVLAHEPEARAKRLAPKTALEVAGHRGPVLGMHDVGELHTAHDLLHRVADDGGESLVRVEEAIARAHVHAHERLLGERVEVLLRFGEESGAALHDGDDLVKRARHVTGLPRELRAGGGIARGEAPGQVDEGGIHTRVTEITSPDTAWTSGASSPESRR